MSGQRGERLALFEWAVSSIGRAPALHAGGSEFKSRTVQIVKWDVYKKEKFTSFIC